MNRGKGKRWVKLVNVVSEGRLIAPGTLGKSIAYTDRSEVIRIGVDHFEVPMRGIREIDDVGDFGSEDTAVVARRVSV